jgi:hypothetical protein
MKRTHWLLMLRLVLLTTICLGVYRETGIETAFAIAYLGICIQLAGATLAKIVTVIERIKK